jgi:hypothetical protein
MQQGVSLPYSKTPAITPYPQPAQSHHTIPIRTVLILSPSTPRSQLGHFPSGSPTKTLYAFSSPMRATRFANHVLFVHSNNIWKEVQVNTKIINKGEFMKLLKIS